MSRIGKLPIKIPEGVTITVEPDTVYVTGPKGKLSTPTLEDINIKIEQNTLEVSRNNDLPKVRAKHGLMRALINNMVVGVTEGFTKKLEINGVGFKVAMQGTDLNMSLGFSHEVIYKIPAGIVASIAQNVITIEGIDKQLVGQVSAEIRKLKKPEPYKGKGIRYVGEHVIRKSGKSGKDK